MTFLPMSMQAIADEEGSITLVNTYMRKTESESHMYTWASHRNAIFDIALAGSLPKQTSSAVAACVVDAQNRIRRARLPSPSFISDRIHADGDDLLATASGDQSIRVWDLSRAVSCIHAQDIVCYAYI